MLLCPSCNKQFENDTEFCDECGSQVVDVVLCPTCGVYTDSGLAQCPNCGANFDLQSNSNAQSNAIKSPKKKFVKKLLAIGIPCVSVILAVAIFLTIFITKKKRENYVFYLKDGELYFTHTLKINPSEITDEFSGRSIWGIWNYYPWLSDNGKYIFFIDEESTLLYCKANDPDKDTEEIDSDVHSYFVSENGKRVTYLKDYDDESSCGTLYQSNLKKSEKIDSDVSSFLSSADGKVIYYMSDENDLYRWADNKKKKLESEIDDIEYIDEKFETVYYTKEDVLYKQVGKKDADEIASDVKEVLEIYDSGAMYYVTTSNEESEATLFDFVEDDLAESDAAITAPVKPVEPKYPDYDDYSSYDAYYAAYEAYTAARSKYSEEYNKYLTNYRIYQAKLSRDELRAELKSSEYTGATACLYYYDGDESYLLNDTYKNTRDAANDSAVLVFSSYNRADVEKIKLSNITYAYQVQDMVESALASSYNYYVATGDSTTLIECESATHIRVDDTGESIYFMDKMSEDGEQGNLYFINVSGSDVSEAEFFDEKVYANSCYFYGNDKFVYLKNYDSEKARGELYINGKKVDDDVSYSDYAYIESTDTLVYITDWNSNKEYGTLNTYQKGKRVTVEDDVHTFDITPGGEIVYLYDYDIEDEEGELFVYKNNKSKFIDDGVSAILPSINYEMISRIYYGNNYYYY